MDPINEPGLAPVQVSPASEAERPLIAGLVQFYIYDFSELEPVGSNDFEFDAQGGYQPFSDFAAFWDQPNHHALVTRCAEAVAGFALLNTNSHQGGLVERNMAEFFVARKYRRHGVASEAVRQILGLYPGRWEVAVVARNTAAQLFWPRAIGSADNVTGLTRLEGDGEQWRGPIWTFIAGEKVSQSAIEPGTGARRVR